MSYNCENAGGRQMGETAPVLTCHVWEPVPNFSGRYRCSLCNCMGYRGIVTVDGDGAPGGHQTAWQSKTPRRAFTIWPYICKAEGCKAPAQGYGKYQYCKGHRA